MPENNETEIKEKPRIFVHPGRIFGFEAILFVLVLVSGVFTALRLQRIFAAQGMPAPTISVFWFILYFVLSTAIILLIVYFSKRQRIKGIFFKTIFILAISVGNLYFFTVWLPDYAAVFLTFILTVFLIKKPLLFLHNLAFIFAAAAMGAGLGLQLRADIVVFLLLIFSLYDFIAVYKTKHMVKIAKEMLATNAILGFVIPQNIADFKISLKQSIPDGKFLVLGGGDVVFPLILASSLIKEGILNSLIVAVFSLIGLFVGFLIFISQKTRTPMPALPPIAIFSIIGYLLTKII